MHTALAGNAGPGRLIPTQPLSKEKPGLAGPSAFEFLPGVVVDPTRSSIYLMNDQKGIDAVDLNSGKTIWTSRKSHKPLCLYKNILFSLRDIGPSSHIFSVVGINIDSPVDTVFEAAVELPKNVSTSISDTMENSFRLMVHKNNSDFIINWYFSKKKITGMDSNDVANVSGILKLDPEKKTLVSLSSTDRVLLASHLKPDVPENIRDQFQTGRIAKPLLRTETVFAGIERGSNKNGRQTLLHRWNKNGEPLPKAVIFKNQFSYRYPSADSRHLLGSKIMDGSKKAPHQYIWSLVSSETGEIIGEIKSQLAGARFFIWKSSLIHTSPPVRAQIKGKWVFQGFQISSIDLKTNNLLWKTNFRDVFYRGPLPPEQ